MVISFNSNINNHRQFHAKTSKSNAYKAENTDKAKSLYEIEVAKIHQQFKNEFRKYIQDTAKLGQRPTGSILAEIAGLSTEAQTILKGVAIELEEYIKESNPAQEQIKQYIQDYIKKNPDTESGRQEVLNFLKSDINKWEYFIKGRFAERSSFKYTQLSHYDLTPNALQKRTAMFLGQIKNQIKIIPNRLQKTMQYVIGKYCSFLHGFNPYIPFGVNGTKQDSKKLNQIIDYMMNEFQFLPSKLNLYYDTTRKTLMSWSPYEKKLSINCAYLNLVRNDSIVHELSHAMSSFEISLTLQDYNKTSKLHLTGGQFSHYTNKWEYTRKYINELLADLFGHCYTQLPHKEGYPHTYIIIPALQKCTNQKLVNQIHLQLLKNYKYKPGLVRNRFYNLFNAVLDLKSQHNISRSEFLDNTIDSAYFFRKVIWARQIEKAINANTYLNPPEGTLYADHVDLNDLLEKNPLTLKMVA